MGKMLNVAGLGSAFPLATCTGFSKVFKGKE